MNVMVIAVVSLKEIFAPTVVGVQPTFAVRDLCVAADGEIRHYGKAMVDDRVERVYVASRDNGLSWKTHLAETNDVGSMARSPWSGEWITFTGKDPVMLVRSKKEPVDLPELRAPGWHLVAVTWDCDNGKAVLSVDGKPARTVSLASGSRFGLSYLHLQTLAEGTDAQGTYFREFAKK